MKIDSIQNNSTAFGAIVVKTIPMRQAIETMRSKASYKPQLALWEKVETAMNNHPSNMHIFPEKYGMNWNKANMQGVLNTVKDQYVNRDQIYSDTCHAILGVWKSILNPANKDKFNIIVGKGYSSIYQKWWTENIAPIWKDIQELF